MTDSTPIKAEVEASITVLQHLLTIATKTNDHGRALTYTAVLNDLQMLDQIMVR